MHTLFFGALWAAHRALVPSRRPKWDKQQVYDIIPDFIVQFLHNQVYRTVIVGLDFVMIMV